MTTVDPRDFYAVGDKVVRQSHGSVELDEVTAVTDKSVTFKYNTRIVRSQIKDQGLGIIRGSWSSLYFYPVSHPRTAELRLQIRRNQALSQLRVAVGNLNRTSTVTVSDLDAIIKAATAARDVIQAAAAGTP